MKQSIVALLLTICLNALVAQVSMANDVLLAHFKNLSFRHIGPDGNRVIAATGIAGDPLTYYVGAASGGLWKTEDGGITWRPVFDEQDVASVGAVAVTPSNPDIVWAGTGETNVRSSIGLPPINGTKVR